MIRRIFGVLMLLIGLSGVGLSVAGTIIGRRVVDTIGAGIDRSLALTSESLDTVQETLALAKTTVSDVNDSLDTVEATAADLSLTIDQTRPLLNQVAAVASEDAPASVEAMQDAFPEMVQVAAIIDDTLTTLSRFRIDENIFGIEIKYDLGINYAPDVPFDESVSDIGSSMDDLPGRLRSIKGYITVTNQNLEQVSRDVLAISSDLGVINGRIAQIDPLLNDYARLAGDANDGARQARALVSEKLDVAKGIITIVMVWIGLTQAAPLYVGWELASGRRKG